MGKTIMGSDPQQVGSAQFGTKGQMSFIEQLMEGMGPQAQQTMMQFLQPNDPAQFEEMFQKSFVDPAMMNFEQQVLPSVQQRFVDAGAGSSSALNQALGQSATDLTTMLGSNRAQMMQNQQQNSLQALGLMGGMAGQRMQDPIIKQNQGLFAPLVTAAGRAAGAYAGMR